MSTVTTVTSLLCSDGLYSYSVLCTVYSVLCTVIVLPSGSSDLSLVPSFSAWDRDKDKNIVITGYWILDLDDFRSKSNEIKPFQHFFQAWGWEGSSGSE